MARMAVRRSPWLVINYSVLPKLNPTDPARTRTELSELFSPAAPFLIFNTCFSSMVKTSDSGKFNLGGKDDRSRSELTTLLKSYEFSEVQIDKIIKRYPKILSLRASTNLKPKLDYLVERGFSGSALHSIIASKPDIFDRSLHGHMKPRYQFLKAYLMEHVNLVIMRNSWLLRQYSVESGVEYLKKQGVPDKSIGKLLAAAPNPLGYGKNRLAKLVETTKALGIEPADSMFIWYIKMFGSMSKTSWKKKLEVFRSLGWSDQDIRDTLLRYPLCFQISEEKLRENIDFYVDTVKIERKAIIAAPNLLMFSSNERIIPRYEVMKLLKEHNLLESCKASTFFRGPEKQFIRRYIEKNLEQVPLLLQVYHDSKKAKPDSARLHS